MKATIVLLPGDGIGPEIMASANQVLNRLGELFGHEFSMQSHLIGGAAIDALGTALPLKTLNACQQADAILLAAVGGPKWDDPTAPVRPEQGLLGLRKELGLYANLRPVSLHPDLQYASPLRSDRLAGVDLLVVRELTGGIYFGEPRERRLSDGLIEAVDTMVYNRTEIERIAHIAFQLAHGRRKKVSSIDKANVLESSRLWRETVSQVGKSYPEIELEHLLIDATAMYLITQPVRFDILLTGNMFGDILSDEASVLSGSMGNLPSASLGQTANEHGYPRGLYEPIHGSAPDIAGAGIANPIGMILSTAMLLMHSLGLSHEAVQVENAVGATISAGHRTVDLALHDEPSLNTTEMTGQIISRLERSSQI